MLARSYREQNQRVQHVVKKERDRQGNGSALNFNPVSGNASTTATAKKRNKSNKNLISAFAKSPLQQNNFKPSQESASQPASYNQLIGTVQHSSAREYFVMHHSFTMHKTG